MFDYVDGLSYKCYKISLSLGGSYIDCCQWIKEKEANKKARNNDDMCLNYAVSAALSHEKIRKNPQRITKIRPFVDQCKWKEMNFSAGSKDWKKFEPKKQNNRS